VNGVPPAARFEQRVERQRIAHRLLAAWIIWLLLPARENLLLRSRSGLRSRCRPQAHGVLVEIVPGAGSPMNDRWRCREAAPFSEIDTGKFVPAFAVCIRSAVRPPQPLPPKAFGIAGLHLLHLIRMRAQVGRQLVVWT